jgi:CubicO group peptidase (beta-lactamase class C family)
MKRIYTILFLIFVLQINSQSLYFPPLTGNTWDTLSPNRFNYCNERIDSLYNYLQAKNSKSFILLRNGKIVLEKYFGTFTIDSTWYWASAGKSLTGFMVGIAADKGLININNKVSDYLWSNWTSAPLIKENLIKVSDLLQMTSGLDPAMPLPCTNEDSSKSCLSYSINANTNWFYHSGAYRQLQAVISKVSGLSYNQVTDLWVESKTGMSGFWFNSIYYSKARDMARFGLLNLNKGIWANDTVLKSSSYFNAMTNSSQSFNLAYGYLWWLCGKSSFKVPGLNTNIPGSLVPNAPNDAFCALGKNDQKIYVVPSQSLVLVRQGNHSGTSSLAVSDFDNVMWDYVNKLTQCPTTSIKNITTNNSIEIYPNPASDLLFIKKLNTSIYITKTEIYTFAEKLICVSNENEINVSELNNGMYLIKCYLSNGNVILKKIAIQKIN